MSGQLSVVERVRRAVKHAMFFLLCRGERTRYYQLRSKTAFLLLRLGLYEGKNLRFLKNLVKTGDSVVDVGASFGVYSYTLAKLVGENGRVFAFEPLPDIFAALREKLACRKNVTLYNLALSDSGPCKERIRLPLLFGKIPEPALASVENLELPSEEIEIDLNSLDNILAAGPRVSFIKVDIEGHEMSFLRGARRLIERDRPVIQFEENNMPNKLDGYQQLAHEINYAVAISHFDQLRPIAEDLNASEINFYLVPTENLRGQKVSV